MSFLFEKLFVYQKAFQFTDNIYVACDAFPRGYYSLADQLKRASTSILANIAEGNGRWHKKDRKNFFMIARGSAFECVPLIELCKVRNLIAEQEANVFYENLTEISKMISALINGIENKRISG